ncbi:hypothetical protein QJS66_18585 [Kocuria rhizophila]|nr:hypothetical protein QJS66_18585 [Kocuria rhizophila]
MSRRRASASWTSCFPPGGTDPQDTPDSRWSRIRAVRGAGLRRRPLSARGARRHCVSGAARRVVTNAHVVAG